MQNAIRRQIKLLSSRQLQRAEDGRKKEQEYAEKFTRRTGLPAIVPPARTTYPTRHFDPIWCKRNANFLSKTIWHKIQAGTYRPKPAITFNIPKAGGGFRPTMQFSIPDSAVAGVLNRALTFRNLKKQSGNSFAYRPDRNVFDAILKVNGAIRSGRNFVIQLDFEKYFDSIPHYYLLQLLHNRDFLTISPAERGAIKNFLTHAYASRDEYKIGNFSFRNTGTPQGSAISLSLANLANQALDYELEALNGQFARYADDTVVLCYTYEDALQTHRSFIAHCERSGLILNAKKSEGIRALSNRDEEILTIPNFKFLGYGVSRDGLFMHEDVEKRLKRNLSRLINIYLVHYIEKHGANLSRAGSGYDWDLIGLISEMRNILYGGLSEAEIREFIKGGSKLRQMRGLMGFYALLDKSDALVRLDGWVASTIKQALYKRYAIMGASLTRPPSRSLIDGTWYDASKFNSPTFRPDPSLPSFVRGWAAARKYFFCFGLQDVEAPRYVSYY